MTQGTVIHGVRSPAQSGVKQGERISVIKWKPDAQYEIHAGRLLRATDTDWHIIIGDLVLQFPRNEWNWCIE